ncbi:MAG TPA: hypothetical protein VNH63_01360 [Gemmatimonadales bacterium]|nr:hypothetical protein [Gemmatimonadales bacterium]
MTRAAAVLAFVALATPLAAQQAAPPPPATGHGSRFLVHWGKWATAAGAIAFTAMGAREHHYSDIEWNQLLDICRNNNADCTVGSNGRYLNGNAELLYQASLQFDRRARRWLLGAQAAALATAALFITDLRHHTGEPGNIPFKPVSLEVAPTRSGAALSVRVAF